MAAASVWSTSELAPGFSMAFLTTTSTGVPLKSTVPTIFLLSLITSFPEPAGAMARNVILRSAGFSSRESATRFRYTRFSLRSPGCHTAPAREPPVGISLPVARESEDGWHKVDIPMFTTGVLR